MGEALTTWIASGVVDVTSAILLVSSCCLSAAFFASHSFFWALTLPCEQAAMVAIDRLCRALHNRAIAKIANCSHGSVSASKKEWLAKKMQQEAATQEIEISPKLLPASRDVTPEDVSNSSLPSGQT